MTPARSPACVAWVAALLAAVVGLSACASDDGERAKPRAAAPGAPLSVAGVELYPIPSAVADVCRSAQREASIEVLCPTRLPRPVRDIYGASALPPPVLTAFRWDTGGVDFSYSGEYGRPRLDRPERFFHLQVVEQDRHQRLPPGARPAELGGRGGLLARATSLDYAAESYFANHWRFFWSDGGADYAATLHAFGPRTEPLLDWFVAELRPARALPRRRPSDGVETFRVPVPGPVSLAAAGDAIWVAGQGDRNAIGGWLAPLDPESGETVRRRVRIGTGGPSALAAGESLWVAHRGAGLKRVDGSRVEPLDTARELVAVTERKGEVWIVDYGTPPGRGSVLKLSRGAERVVARRPAGRAPAAIAAGAGGVWVTSNLDDVVTRFDPGTARPTATIEVGEGPVGVTVAAGAVWVANTEDHTVSRIDPGRDVVTDTIAVGRGPRALAAGEGSIWVANGLDDTVSRIDAGTRRVEETIRVGAGPTAVAIAAGAVWVANLHDQTVSRIEP